MYRHVMASFCRLPNINPRTLGTRITSATSLICIMKMDPILEFCSYLDSAIVTQPNEKQHYHRPVEVTAVFSYIKSIRNNISDMQQQQCEQKSWANCVRLSLKNNLVLKQFQIINLNSKKCFKIFVLINNLLCYI